MLNTRRKEDLLLDTCMSMQQRIVVDNTNVTRKDRCRYFLKSGAYRYKVVGYFFDEPVDFCIARNKK